uniref:S1-like domain-containing protein n=1 Tax=Corethron hystrix TaxID=216773 RepID=A0A7S1BRC9_9STRA|mmetsp:Transcript_36893/g.86164  ORF Transcript_36893/g.86164 Transcript_36893/m.86164 type:complete len:254 (+) Transcript_36893:167-928(+)
MSGLGRRSHYRKHVMESVRTGNYVTPDYSSGERIARVLGTRGGNLFEVDVAEDPRSDHDANDVVEHPPATSAVSNIAPASENLEPSRKAADLALLPTKFKNLIYVKRGDYVVVKSGESGEEEHTSAVRYIIRHILFRDQVKYLREGRAGPHLWPRRFGLEGEREGVRATSGEEEAIVAAALQAARERTGGGDFRFEGGVVDDGDGDRKEGGELMDGEEEDPESELDDDDLFVNTNRLAALHVDDSESSSSEEE